MCLKSNRGAVSSLLPPLLNVYGTGMVHSVFRNGMNIKFSEGYVFLSGTDMPLSSIGISVPEPLFSTVLDSIRPGDMVVKKKDQLVIYGFREVVVVNTSDYEVVNLKIPKIEFSNKGLVSESAVYQYLETFNFEDKIGLELDERTRYHLGQLIHSKWLKNDLLDHLYYFIGRGLGLTPSGDDMLAGFTMALKAFRKDEPWTGILVQAVGVKRTTFVSMAYYKALFNDHLSENFIRLIRLTWTENVQNLKEAVDEIGLYGHTSGYDTLFGFLLGLKYLLSS